MTSRLVAVLPVDCLHGEGVQWNASDECLWWTDISASRLHRWHLASGAHHMFETPERLGSFAFIENDPRLLAAFATGLALFDPVTGVLDWLARPETAGSGRRFNDGRADRQGRFWAGTMVEDAPRADAFSASLYCLDGDARIRVPVTGVGISNGVCFSPDGGRMYFADSARNAIDVFDLDADSGMIGGRREFARTQHGVEPDGACIDESGAMWSAQWGAGQVVRYAPDGRIIGTVAVPATQPTCAAFAGRNLDLLCVTTAHIGLDAAARAAQPQAGHVFVYQTDARGLPESRVRLDNAVLEYTGTAPKP